MKPFPKSSYLKISISFYIFRLNSVKIYVKSIGQNVSSTGPGNPGIIEIALSILHLKMLPNSTHNHNFQL